MALVEAEVPVQKRAVHSGRIVLNFGYADGDLHVTAVVRLHMADENGDPLRRREADHDLLAEMPKKKTSISRLVRDVIKEAEAHL